MKTNNIVKPECSGCTACKSICSRGAIEMVEDEQGFLYPSLNSALCISCGKCERVCPFHADFLKSDNFDISFVYAAKSKNEDLTALSSSGGVGYLLATRFIENGGVVYGAGFDENMNVVHKRIERPDDVKQISGSKYVQSELGSTYIDIRDILTTSEKPVLFFGTACQTAGLYNYLGEELSRRVYLCDVLCHGVPSPGVYREYLKRLEKRNRCGIQSVTFRSKANGWVSAIAGQKVVFKNGNETNIKLFTRLFFDHYTLRPSCFNCPYTNLHKPSDITIADFWKIKDYDTSFYSKNGVSMVLLNSEKGDELFKTIHDDIIDKCMDVSCCTADQFHRPAQIKTDGVLFYNTVKKYGYDKTFQSFETKYFFQSVKNRLMPKRK